MKKFTWQACLLISYLIFLASYITNAQWYDPKKVNSKAATIYAEALNNARNEKYNTAIQQNRHGKPITGKYRQKTDDAKDDLNGSEHGKSL